MRVRFGCAHRAAETQSAQRDTPWPPRYRGDLDTLPAPEQTRGRGVSYLRPYAVKPYAGDRARACPRRCHARGAPPRAAVVCCVARQLAHTSAREAGRRGRGAGRMARGARHVLFTVSLRVSPIDTRLERVDEATDARRPQHAPHTPGPKMSLDGPRPRGVWCIRRVHGSLTRRRQPPPTQS